MESVTLLPRLLLGAVTALLLPGCLEFETQTIEFEYLPASDSAYLYLVYHGLWFDGDDQAAGEKALKRAVDGDEFCLVDWPFHLHPQEMADDDHPVARLIGKSLAVSNLGFFLDAKGQLSGGQMVALENVSATLAKANAHFNAWLAAGKGRPEGAGWDDETAKLMLDAAERKHAWWRVSPNSFEWHGFVSESDLIKVKREGLASFAKTKEKQRDGLVELLAQTPVSFLREGKAVRVILGNPGGRLRLEVPLLEEKRKYKPNLVEFAQKTYGFSLDARVAPLLLNPGDSPMGRFAQSMYRRERIRLLLAQEGELAAKRLEEEFATLPDAPERATLPDDVRAFWRAWLDRQSGQR